MSKPIMAFASHVWQNKSPIITFNYDTLTEIALELASHNEWQRKNAYLIDFAGEVTPDNFDLNPIYSKEGTNSMLKLHGSVNWFKFPNLSDLTEKSQGVKPFSRIPRDSDFSSLSTQLFFSPREDF
ncbi:MAG TPA: hypothetical protein VKK79_20895, partial [Candidatus Lokiarchaeia archaeon]|nr:hypothetical protein [Candidatus Lokiarchaeia archaeon]